MTPSRYTLISQQDGLSLSLLLTQPQERPKGVLQLSHGMCEHKGRYLPMMEHFTHLGYACIAHDHRGHGESIRQRSDLGYFYQNGAQNAIDDLYQVSRWAKGRFPGLPLFLYGHSMGSLIARAYIKRYDGALSGLFVAGCPSDPNLSVPGHRLLERMAKRRGDHYRSQLIQRLAFGLFDRKFSEKDPNAWICSDPQVRQRYHTDPLCDFIFTLNGFTALLDLFDQVYGNEGWRVANPNLPIRFLSGRDDPCLISESRFLQAAAHLEEVGYRKVTTRLFKGMRHEVHNETDRLRVFRDMEEHLKLWRQTKAE